LLRGRVGRDIEVFGSQVQQGVSHAPSGIVSHVASVDQTPNDFVGKLSIEGTCMEKRSVGRGFLRCGVLG
jgi:hypothetical protein